MTVRPAASAPPRCAPTTSSTFNLNALNANAIFSAKWHIDHLLRQRVRQRAPHGAPARLINAAHVPIHIQSSYTSVSLLQSPAYYNRQQWHVSRFETQAAQLLGCTPVIAKLCSLCQFVPVPVRVGFARSVLNAQATGWRTMCSHHYCVRYIRDQFPPTHIVYNVV